MGCNPSTRLRLAQGFAPRKEALFTGGSILNILGAQPSVNVPGLGDKILRSRPSEGYASPFDLLGALGGDRAGFERARRFVTLLSWSDPEVANPVPIPPYAG